MARRTEATPDDTIYVARATGVVRIGDTEYRYVSGRTRVRAGHPLLKVLSDKFRPEASDTEKVVSIRAADAPRAARSPVPEPTPEPTAHEGLPEPVTGVEVPADGTLSEPIEGDPDGAPSPDVAVWRNGENIANSGTTES